MIILIKKIITLWVVFTILNTINAQTVDEILHKHFEVIGQEKLSEINSAVIDMVVIQNSVEIPYKMHIKRPNKIRTELKYQGLTQILFLNKDEGWKIDPFKGEYDYVPLNKDEMDLLKDETDLDREWFNYKAKGYSIETLGVETHEGRKTFVLKVIKPSGYDKTIYIDTKTYLILKKKYKQIIDDSVTNITEFLDDYRKVNGILFPHSYEFSYGNQKIKVEKIELDKELSDDLFEKP